MAKLVRPLNRQQRYQRRKQRKVREIIRLLYLAHALGNVRQACRLTGFNHDDFYRYRRIYARGGEPALLRLQLKVTLHLKKRPVTAGVHSTKTRFRLRSIP